MYAHIMADPTLLDDDRLLMQAIIGGHSIPSERWIAFDVEVPDPETARAVRDALLGIFLLRTSSEIEQLMVKLSAIEDKDERMRVVFKLQQLIDRREDLKRRYADTPHDISWLDAETASPS
jgi:hypothetical protein